MACSSCHKFSDLVEKQHPLNPRPEGPWAYLERSRERTLDVSKERWTLRRSLEAVANLRR